MNQLFIRIDLEYPITGCIIQIMVSGFAETIFPRMKIDFICIFPGDFYRPVLGTCIDNDDFISDILYTFQAII